MEDQPKKMVTVQTAINAQLQKVWDYWTNPNHITRWNYASDEWHTPRAENDLRTGGRFISRMEAKDGSMGFDFGGVYDEVRPHEYIEYTMDDGRKVKVTFTGDGNKTTVVEYFEAENTNSIEMQQAGWQTILDNFRRYTEIN